MAVPFTLTCKRSLSRSLYLKVPAIGLVMLAVLHFSGQWRTPPLLDARLSLLICSIFFALFLCGAARTPFTRSVTLDNDQQEITIHYMSPLRQENALRIPFDQFGIKTDSTFGVRGYGIKWRVYLQRNGRTVYDLSSDEYGFEESQMTDLVEKLKQCAGA
jgi:hypothetical protein